MSNLVYGIHPVDSLVRSDRAKEIFVLEKQNINCKINTIIDDARLKNIKVTLIGSLKSLPVQIGKNTNHQNIFAIEKNTLRIYSESNIVNLIAADNKAFILILDSLQDPHNFGACIRSAHSAGVDFIIIAKNNNTRVNATVRKVACGAAEYIKLVVVTNLVRTIEKLKKLGVWIIGLTSEANDSLYDMNLNDSIAIVAGAEGDGIHQRIKASCDFLAKLPMLGKVSSLNVSVTVGIAVYETVRQRSIK